MTPTQIHRLGAFPILTCVLLILAGLAFAPCLVFAAHTQRFLDESYDDFQAGQTTTSTLASDGWLSVSPVKEKIYAPAQIDALWDASVAPDGRLIIGSGPSGKVLQIDVNSSGSLLTKTDLLHVTAVAAPAADGTVFAGGAPGGKVWKISKTGEKTLFFDTKEKYVWCILPTPSGDIYIATGTKGKIFRVGPDGKGKEFAALKKVTNVLFLAQDANGDLLATTQGKAMLVRLDAKGTPFVIYEADEDEIRRVAVAPDGALWIAINDAKGQGIAQRVSRPVAAAIINASKSGNQGPGGSPGMDQSSDDEGGEAPPPRMMRPPSGPRGRGGARVLRLDAKGFIQLEWPANDSPIHDLVLDAKGDWAYIAAGAEGALCRVDRLGRHQLIGGVRESGILRLIRMDKGELYAFTNAPGVVYRFRPGQLSAGEYLSKPLDAQMPVRWGRARIEGSIPAGASVLFATRTGNTSDPEEFWSEWSEDIQVSPGAELLIKSQPARRIQYRLLIRAASNEVSSVPRVESVEIPYVLPNLPPVVKDVSVKFQAEGGGGRPGGGPGGRPSGMPRMGGPGGDNEGGPPRSSSRAGGRNSGQRGGSSSGPSGAIGAEAESNPKKMTVSWNAADPNSDPMRFKVYLRSEGESLWVLLEKNLEANEYVIDTTMLTDGRYQAKVEAEDRPANLPDESFKVEATSDPFDVDDTPPEIKALGSPAGGKGGAVRVSFSGSDATSRIASAEWRLNAGDWQFLAPEDGLFDSKNESFRFEIPAEDFEKKDSALLTVRITDERGNTTLAQTTAVLNH